MDTRIDWSGLAGQIAVFARHHVRCGGVDIDVPALPSGLGSRLLLACRCGETLEQAVPGMVLSAAAYRQLLARAKPAA